MVIFLNGQKKQHFGKAEYNDGIVTVLKGSKINCEDRYPKCQ